MSEFHARMPCSNHLSRNRLIQLSILPLNTIRVCLVYSNPDSLISVPKMLRSKPVSLILPECQTQGAVGQLVEETEANRIKLSCSNEKIQPPPFSLNLLKFFINTELFPRDSVPPHSMMLQHAQDLDIKAFTSINMGPNLIENIIVLSSTFPLLNQARVLS